MAASKCPKCENTRFELAEESPTGSNYKLQFVRCASCKTVIGVLEYYSTSVLIRKLAKKLNIDLDY